MTDTGELMKYLISLSALTVALAGSGLISQAQAADQISFVGSIESSACKVESGDTVILGKYLLSDGLDDKSIGDSFGEKRFKVSLTGCPKDTEITVDFDGPREDNGYIDIEAGQDAAKGLAIKLSKTSIILPESEETDRELELEVSYIKTAQKITSGPANGTVTLIITYDGFEKI